MKNTRLEFGWINGMTKKIWIKLKRLIKEDQASILISSLVFLMVITFLLSGLGIIIASEARQQAMIKDNYLAKAMIQKAYYIMKEMDPSDLASLASKTISFNQGQVVASQDEEGIFSFTASLANDYQYSQTNRLYFPDQLDEELEEEEGEEKDHLENLEEDSHDQVSEDEDQVSKDEDQESSSSPNPDSKDQESQSGGPEESNPVSTKLDQEKASPDG